jgi:two-component system, OmpR family, phosphate regulon sensor histidine kinase PhoR
VSARARLYLASVAVVVIAVLVSSVVVAGEIRAYLVARIEGELGAHARAAATLLSRVEPHSAADVDAAIDELARSVGARLTVIDADGVVRADSELSLEEIAHTENHQQRPEIVRARERAYGVAGRYSATLHTEMLYVALPFSGARLAPDGAATSGVVRAAMPLSEVDHAIARARTLIALGGAVGIVLALVMSFFAAHLFTQSLRDLVRRAQKVTGQPTSENPDEIGALAGTFRILSRDLERTVASLAGARDRFATVLESMREGVVALDKSGAVEMTNAAARALLALPEDAALQPLTSLVTAPALDEVVTRAREGHAATAEIALTDPARVLEATATPIRTSGGAIVVVRDVTELRRLEAVRREFVANVSHELRTPISVIAANAETLMLGALDDSARAQSFVQAIANNAERLSRLIADLLDLSRLESGREKLTPEPFSVAPLVEKVQAALRVAVESRRHALFINVPADIRVRADARALEQVVTNLLENAIKYTPPGGSIAVRARVDGDEVELAFEDDGTGIAPEHRARVFERFYRVDAGRSREAGGTGLGLAIVKHLVELMSGRVVLAPNEPRGSRFVVRLPRA